MEEHKKCLTRLGTGKYEHLLGVDDEPRPLVPSCHGSMIIG